MGDSEFAIFCQYANAQTITSAVAELQAKDLNLEVEAAAQKLKLVSQTSSELEIESWAKKGWKPLD